MAEYIERESVEKFIMDGLNNSDVYERFGHDAIKIIAEVHYMPAADVAPVRHGQWLRSDDDWDSLTSIRCSICGEEWCFEMIDDVTLLNYKYCPNCGTKMDGGADNGT